MMNNISQRLMTEDYELFLWNTNKFWYMGVLNFVW
jgi:hypothetical protein